jgi:hypothetical protein
VNPHGGPWLRDSWGYNSEVQFLANRGYAVLQHNYRGSTGYGRKFWEASFKQWGKAMQDDITDGVKWLIKEGIADPKRVGIYGRQPMAAMQLWRDSPSLPICTPPELITLASLTSSLSSKPFHLIGSRTWKWFTRWLGILKKRRTC